MIEEDKTKAKEEKLEKKIDEAPSKNLKTEEKKESKAVLSKKIIKIVKKEAVVNGRNLNISTKQAVAICNFIRNRNIDAAISNLGLVTTYKKAVPMKGEIPHRKGKIMSGRYPIKAVKEFIRLLKSLKANGMINELELEKFKIFCMANQASRPYKRFGQGKIKRSHVVIKLIPVGGER